MDFKFGSPSLYTMGMVDLYVYGRNGNVLYYNNKTSTNKFQTTQSLDQVRAGLSAPVVINLSHSTGFTGDVQAEDFSLVPRSFQTGGNLAMNGRTIWKETVTADSDGKLTVSNTPVPNYAESASDENYVCYVDNSEINYGVNPTTKEVQNFVGTAGQKYCVKYFINVASAQELTIPTSFNSTTAYVMARMAVYQGQVNGAQDGRNSSLAGFLYIHVPEAQFVNGDGGVGGSQIEHSSTSLHFEALSHNVEDGGCANCDLGNSVFGYMVYVPCGDVAQAVDGLVVIGGGVSVTAGGAAVQIPVKYIINNEIVQPQYTDLTYTSAATSTATVSADGKVTGVAAGSTKVTITITRKPSISTDANITVVSGS